MKNKHYSTPSSEESCSVTKSLFNSLEVVSLPAFFCPLFLVVRDASALHLQLRLAALVHKCHGDRGVMLCGAVRRRQNQHSQHEARKSD